MRESVQLGIAIIGCLVGLSGAFFAVFSRWKGSVEKSYAAQRDFAHLQRNYDQLNINIQQMIKEQDSRFDRLDQGQSELRAIIMSALVKRKEE